ncbi:hypothetical protein FJZ17_04060 [Candidatus Pacearchaeota archaeon]|nr:hypothetical protein [Candidatus Pacearchaeota archaeon]
MGIGLSPEDIPENPEDAAQMGRDYLKKEWKIILNKSEFWGPMIRAYDRASPVINPLSRYSIGMQPEFSWLYLVNLVVGITLIIYLYRVLDIFSTFSKNVSLIISLALSVILAVFQVQPKISAGIVALIATLTLWWVQLIVVVLVMIALIYLDAVSGGIEKKLEEWKEKKKKMLEEEQEVLNRARLKIAADSAEKITRELGKGEE